MQRPEDGEPFCCVDVQGPVHFWKHRTSEKTQGWRSRLVIAHPCGEFTVTTMKLKAEEGKVSQLRTATK